jgi:hypothetical protein
MVPVIALWWQILLAAVLVFVVSSIIHMVLRYHKTDFKRLPDEEAVRTVLGKLDLPPGQYAFPCVQDMKQMKTPEVMKKYQEGPVGILTMLPKGPVNMGKHLLQWFVYSIVISVFVAYVTGRTQAAGAQYLAVFRIAGTTAWLGYAGAHLWAGIWKGVPRSCVTKDTFDGLVYALATAAVFAGFWPR